jgi:hypothetical protein
MQKPATLSTLAYLTRGHNYVSVSLRGDLHLFDLVNSMIYDLHLFDLVNSMRQPSSQLTAQESGPIRWALASASPLFCLNGSR